MPKKPNILRTAATLPFGLLIAACSGSGDVVDLGGGSGELEDTVPAACAAPEPNGQVTVVDQAGLEALRGCEELESPLRIMTFAGVDLRPLSSLRVVRGELSIIGDVNDDTTWLDSLEGLESLERVGGLWLRRFSAPTLQPLRNLSEVVGGIHEQGYSQIRIENASSLRTLAGLDNAVGFRQLVVSDNPKLESLDGLQPPSDMDYISLVSNPKLTDIEALSPVRFVNGDLQIVATGIESLDTDFEGVMILMVKDNPALVAITAFDGVVVASQLHIRDNPQLSQLPEFRNLMILNSLVVVGNPQLRWLPTFPMLEGLSGYQEGLDNYKRMQLLQIAGNTSLQQFVAPPRLQAVTSLIIQDNASLSKIDFGALEALTELMIANNPSLASVSLGQLQTVNSLELLDNGLLPTAGFSDVQTFTRDIQGNAGEVAP